MFQLLVCNGTRWTRCICDDVIAWTKVYYKEGANIIHVFNEHNEFLYTVPQEVNNESN